MAQALLRRADLSFRNRCRLRRADFRYELHDPRRVLAPSHRDLLCGVASDLPRWPRFGQLGST